MAVIREYPEVPCKVKDGSRQVTISTSKLKLVYKKGTAPLSSDNLTISSTKAISTPFVWKPGMQQKGNLKGTYRTLDGYDGAEYQYSNPKHEMPIEDGLLATDGWSLIDDSKSLLFDGSTDWDWVTERKSAEGAQDWYFMAYLWVPQPFREPQPSTGIWYGASSRAPWARPALSPSPWALCCSSAWASRRGRPRSASSQAAP